MSSKKNLVWKTIKENWHWYLLFAALMIIICTLIYVQGFTAGAEYGYAVGVNESLQTLLQY